MIVRKKPPHARRTDLVTDAFLRRTAKTLWSRDRTNAIRTAGPIASLPFRPSVADRYRDHALSLSPPVGTPARESAIPISKPERQGKKGQSHESVFYDSAPSERSPAKGILKIFGQPSRLSRDCQRQPPERLRFRRSIRSAWRSYLRSGRRAPKRRDSR